MDTGLLTGHRPALHKRSGEDLSAMDRKSRVFVNVLNNSNEHHCLVPLGRGSQNNQTYHLVNVKVDPFDYIARQVTVKCFH